MGRIVMVWRRVALCIAIAGTLLLTVPEAGLAETTTHGRPLAVVSLGDSYISGNAGRWLGNSPDSTGDRRGTDRAYVATPDPHYDPTLVYGETVDGCWRSDVAEITHVRFPGIRTVNLACSGATTGSIPEQNIELAEVARSHRVVAIVLSIGGNDILFSQIVQACVIAFLGNGSPCNPDQQANVVEPRLPELRAGVGRAIDDIRATMTAAGYRDRSYRLIVQSYPAPMPAAADMRYPESDTDARFLVGGCPFYDADVDWGHTSLPGQLADNLRAVSAEHHAQFLDLRDAFRGHELCSAAARQPETAPQASTSEWIRWIDIAHSQGDAFAESFHPNAYGQEALGRCLRLTLLVFRDVSCHGISGRPPSAAYIRPLR
jgi:lysophospholipase L1-like esterase